MGDSSRTRCGGTYINLNTPRMVPRSMKFEQVYPTRHALRKLNQNRPSSPPATGNITVSTNVMMTQQHMGGDKSHPVAEHQDLIKVVEHDEVKHKEAIEQLEHIRQANAVKQLQELRCLEERIRIQEAEHKESIMRLEQSIEHFEEIRRLEQIERIETITRIREAKQAEEDKYREDIRCLKHAKQLEHAKHLEDITQLEELQRTEEAALLADIKQLEEQHLVQMAKLEEELRQVESANLAQEAQLLGRFQRLNTQTTIEPRLIPPSPHTNTNRVDVIVWGDNIGHVLTPNALTHVTTPKLEQWETTSPIAGGALGTGYAMLHNTDGGVLSWGNNKFGQLGLLDYLDRDHPTSLDYLKEQKIIAVAAGEHHVLAITNTGKLYTWGSNTYGQLGNDILGCTNTPQQVLSTFKIIQVACGLYHSLVLTETGEVYMWGLNNNGTHNHIPFKLDLPERIRYIASGEQHSFAVAATGILYGWGDNKHGQLGIPQIDAVMSPTVINVPWGTNRNITTIAASSHTMILLDNGELYGTGHNKFGQLGLSDADVLEFKLVRTNVTLINVGLAHTVISTTEGKIMTTGDNSRGQLAISSDATSSSEFVVSNATGSNLIVGADHNMAY